MNEVIKILREHAEGTLEQAKREGLDHPLMYVAPKFILELIDLIDVAIPAVEYADEYAWSIIKSEGVQVELGSVKYIDVANAPQDEVNHLITYLDLRDKLMRHRNYPDVIRLKTPSEMELLT